MKRAEDLTEIMNIAYRSKYNLQQKAVSANKPVQLVLHWSAGRYGQYFNDYHINIDYDGTYYLSTDNFAEVKYHNYQKNSGSIGICLCCGYNANTNNLGQYPPTYEQIEACAKVIAVLSEALDLDIDVRHVCTHGESADNLDFTIYYSDYNGYQNNIYGPNYIDQYGVVRSGPCERWDLQFLGSSESPRFVPCMDPQSGGVILRQKASKYRKSFYGH